MSDSTAIAPVRVGLAVGYVEAIHGRGGQPCPEFVPTVQELRYLAEVCL
jgi:hypothetical protein